MTQPKIIKWTSITHKKAAPVIGPHIAELLDSTSEDMDHPSLIVKDATDPDSPLHPHFEWDNDEAAERWRMQQARNMLNHLRVVIDRGKGEELVSVPAFVNIRIEESEPIPTGAIPEGWSPDGDKSNSPHSSALRQRKKQGYMTAARGMTTPLYRKYLLAEAMRTAETYMAKYALFGDDELAVIFEAINAALEMYKKGAADQ